MTGAHSCAMTTLSSVTPLSSDATGPGKVRVLPFMFYRCSEQNPTRCRWITTPSTGPETRPFSTHNACRLRGSTGHQEQGPGNGHSRRRAWRCGGRPVSSCRRALNPQTLAAGRLTRNSADAPPTTPRRCPGRVCPSSTGHLRVPQLGTPRPPARPPLHAAATPGGLTSG